MTISNSETTTESSTTLTATTSLEYTTITTDSTTTVTNVDTTVGDEYAATMSQPYITHQSSAEETDAVPRVASNLNIPATAGGVVAGVIVLLIVIVLAVVIFLELRRNRKLVALTSIGVARRNEYPLSNQGNL